jgi:hypothetical protein
MAERISIAPPSLIEQHRQTAESIADVHYVVGIVVENATQFIPGEAVDELRAAWRRSEELLKELIRRIYPGTAWGEDMRRSWETVLWEIEVQLQRDATIVTPSVPEPFVDLRPGDLLGESGRAKRSTLSRLKDAFFSFWYSEPRTDELRRSAMAGGSDYLNFAASFVGSIPGADKIVEILSLTSQLLELRARRKH